MCVGARGLGECYCGIGRNFKMTHHPMVRILVLSFAVLLASCGSKAPAGKRYQMEGKILALDASSKTATIDAGQIGELLISRPRMVRATRSLVFINTEVTVGKRCIAMANGVFKILRSE